MWKYRCVTENIRKTLMEDHGKFQGENYLPWEGYGSFLEQYNRAETQKKFIFLQNYAPRLASFLEEIRSLALPWSLFKQQAICHNTRFLLSCSCISFTTHPLNEVSRTSISPSSNCNQVPINQLLVTLLTNATQKKLSYKLLLVSLFVCHTNHHLALRLSG